MTLIVCLNASPPESKVSMEVEKNLSYFLSVKLPRLVPFDKIMKFVTQIFPLPYYQMVNTLKTVGIFLKNALSFEKINDGSETKKMYLNIFNFNRVF